MSEIKDIAARIIDHKKGVYCKKVLWYLIAHYGLNAEVRRVIKWEEIKNG